jgi:hypothetical protein
LETTTEKPEVAYKAMERCLQEGIMKHYSELSSEYKLDLTDRNKMYTMATELTNKLLITCPKFIDYIAALNKKLKKESTGDNATGSTEGKFVKLNNREFTYLIIREEGEKETQFLWLKHFNGSERFMIEPDKLRNKSLRVKWQEYEVYLPKANGYYKIKEIVAVELLD